MLVESLEMFEALCEEAKEEAEENDEEPPFNLLFVLILVMLFHFFQNHILRKKIYILLGAENIKSLWNNSMILYLGKHTTPNNQKVIVNLNDVKPKRKYTRRKPAVPKPPPPPAPYFPPYNPTKDIDEDVKILQKQHENMIKKHQSMKQPPPTPPTPQRYSGGPSGGGEGFQEPNVYTPTVNRYGRFMDELNAEEPAQPRRGRGRPHINNVYTHSI
mmetsp:Transcript_34115/g.40125  ORF Transcript_34115/g.40125 Transcript_34115/m.40125 type:complete len:216 (+) Transcript_34115:2657-3304(+)